jgi:hypothetical protein
MSALGMNFIDGEICYLEYMEVQLLNWRSGMESSENSFASPSICRGRTLSGQVTSSWITIDHIFYIGWIERIEVMWLHQI